jgi:hypothetical protein
VQQHVGVGVTDKRLRVRNPDTAEHDMIAGAERMNIEAGSGANIGKQLRVDRVRAQEIVFCGDFEIPRLSRERGPTVMPAHSASAASSVKSLRPSNAALRCAFRIGAKAKACGV